MDSANLLPIRPASTSLASHLAALSSTISQLETLPSQTRWPAYIPLTSRARIPGHIVHPNEVKVNLGEGWWVDMTASEAAEYLRRRKTALLEEQAKLLEGGSTSAEAKDGSPPRSFEATLPPPVQLNALFMGMEGSSSASKAMPAPTLPTESANFPTPKSQPPKKPSASFTPSAPPATSSSKSQTSSVTAKGPSSSPAPRLTPVPSLLSTPDPSAQSTSADSESLEQVLERFLANEQSLAEASGGGGRDSTMTEDGLPIHEIHEDDSGKIIGVRPTPTLTAAEAGRVRPDVEDAEGGDDYHSEEARARRRKLWERVFGPEEDEDDDEAEGDVEAEAEPEPASPVSSSPRSASPELVAPIPSTRSSTSTPVSVPAPTPPAPRSILKPPPPQVRKKSVSFDPTVPLPPDSPDHSERKMGFQLPLGTAADNSGEYAVRPVPVIQVPVPKKGDGFGGMKRGFLDPPGGSKKPAVTEEANKKKPSLFAQRMAQSVVRESVPSSAGAALPPTTAPMPNIPPPTTARVPGLPVMGKSDSSATNTLRSSVVEKPTIASSSSSSNPAVIERRKTYPTDDEGGGDDVGLIDDEDEDEDEEEDEDEYDLDDALLAREVALEYHRRRAYASPYQSQDPDDPAYGYLPSEPSDDGGVLLAMPQVDNTGTGGPTIINPTPDDFRRFVRVGKLENGNLVLAPGEEGWSDDEAGEDGEGIGELEVERQKKRDNRRKVMEGLLGTGGGEEETTLRGKGTIGNSTKVQPGKVMEENDMPPAVMAAPSETTAPAVGGVKERETGTEVSASTAEPPKKMSRFKAARMGG